MIASLVFTAAQIAPAHACDRQDVISHRITRSYVAGLWGFSGGSGSSKSSKNLQTLQCGAVVTSNTTLANDLNCPNTTGFAIQVVGNGITFNGNGHKITAPLANAGVYVQGSGDTVSGIVVRQAHYGIFAYDSPNVTITGNDVSLNTVGIELYADQLAMTGARVTGNIATGNSVFGIETGQWAPGSVVSPVIAGNDFSASGLYAITVTAASFEYSFSTYNRMTGSGGGLYLSDGTFYLHDFSLSSELIPGTQIFADQASSVTIDNVDVSCFTPALPSQQRTGVDFYRVQNFSINGMIARNNDTGLRLETDSGFSTTGTAHNCSFIGNDFAAVSIVSYDGTQYGALDFRNDNFQEPSSSQNIFLSTGTTVAEILEGVIGNGGRGCL